MSNWVEGHDHPFKEGEKFMAIIRHCNPKLKLDDVEIELRVAEDGMYIGDSHDELSYNWDIIKWKKK